MLTPAFLAHDMGIRPNDAPEALSTDSCPRMPSRRNLHVSSPVGLGQQAAVGTEAAAGESHTPAEALEHREGPENGRRLLPTWSH